MELHFVDLANVFVYYPYLKRAKFALAHYVHGSVAPILVRDGANAGWISYKLKDR